MLVGEEDFKQLRFVTHISQQKFVDGYLRDDFELPGITYHPIKEDTELAEGIEIISLSGHTPQILGLVVHLEHTGTIYFYFGCIFNRGKILAQFHPDHQVSSTTQEHFMQPSRKFGRLKKNTIALK